MPNCYIDDTYMDECIIDPRDGKLRHCSTCEAVIQELRDDYDALDKRRRRDGEGPFAVPEFDALLPGEIPILEGFVSTVSLDEFEIMNQSEDDEFFD